MGFTVAPWRSARFALENRLALAVPGSDVPDMAHQHPTGDRLPPRTEVRGSQPKEIQ
jgi:hypothetical protein